jgi:hypothetical protein
MKSFNSQALNMNGILSTNKKPIQPEISSPKNTMKRDNSKDKFLKQANNMSSVLLKTSLQRGSISKKPISTFNNLDNNNSKTDDQSKVNTKVIMMGNIPGINKKDTSNKEIVNVNSKIKNEKIKPTLKETSSVHKIKKQIGKDSHLKK